MLRFAARHFTAILLVAVLGWWAMFYLPDTPSFMVVQLKRAIDARSGERAAGYIDFEGVVRAAGYEVVQKRGGRDALGQLLGKGAIDLFAGPIAGVARAWAVQRVGEGSRDVQVPTVAVAGAIILMSRDGDAAATAFDDASGRKWDIRMARGTDGRWRITEVRNIDELLRELQRRQSRRELPP
ncbi:MAG: hypothetical protein ACREQB_00555 [Candidatus Binataceae bacterium]